MRLPSREGPSGASRTPFFLCPTKPAEPDQLYPDLPPSSLQGSDLLGSHEMSCPTIYYFNVKARAEPFKVALTAKGVAFKVETISREQAKNLEEYPFGQAPRYKDETVDLVQSNAILRHIGRK